MGRLRLAMATAAALLALAGTATAADSFSLPVALFVKARAPIYGVYDARPSRHYKAGEAIHFYVEPRNYGYKQADGLFEFDMTADLLVIQGSNIVFGKKAFLKTDLKSHHQNKEFMLNGSVSFDDAPPGNYTMELVVHDLVSGQTAKTDLPFTIDK